MLKKILHRVLHYYAFILHAERTHPSAAFLELPFLSTSNDWANVAMGKRTNNGYTE